MQLRRSTAQASVLAAALVGLEACERDEPTASLVIYSLWSETIAASLVEPFEIRTGIPTRVRYGSSVQLKATIPKENEDSLALLTQAGVR